MPRMWLQVIGISAVVLALFVGWDFSQRIQTGMRLQQSEQVLMRRVAQAQATNVALVEKKKRVQSNDFVEDYVRRNWHWAREGDILVIAQITPAPTPTPTPQPITSQEAGWWQSVLDFLFGP